MVQYLVEETNRYSVEKSGNSIKCTVREMKTYIGILLTMGIVKLPTIRLYWNNFYRCSAIADVMGLTRFETINRHFHVNDNGKMKQRNEEEYDPLFKIRPLLDHVRSNCKALEPEAKQSVDEQMVKYKGKSNLKHYLPNKPTKWGYKIIARCGVNGIIYNFHVQGDNFPAQPQSIGFCGDVVLYLCDNLPAGQPFLLFCDRWYTSLPLLKWLEEKKIFTTGTIMPNRLRKCPLKSDKELPCRGDMDFIVDANSTIMVVKWMDTKSVLLVSNYFGQAPIGTCLR
jgi:hypothetical protein